VLNDKIKRFYRRSILPHYGRYISSETPQKGQQALHPYSKLWVTYPVLITITPCIVSCNYIRYIATIVLFITDAAIICMANLLSYNALFCIKAVRG
jgi:hypothetical protein